MSDEPSRPTKSPEETGEGSPESDSSEGTSAPAQPARGQDTDITSSDDESQDDDDSVEARKALIRRIRECIGQDLDNLLSSSDSEDTVH